MTLQSVVAAAKETAATTVARTASENDRLGRFPDEAIGALGRVGLLGMMLPRDVGGAGLGARALAEVVAALAEVDASVAMVFLMHACAAMTIAAAKRTTAIERVLGDIAAGRHLSTLAFSETGSRSHFWAPVSRASSLNGSGVRLTARKSFVTSAGHAQSYVASALAPRGVGPTDTTLYLVDARSAGVMVASPWDGLGLRANASAAVTLDGCLVPNDLHLTDDGAGFAAMLSAARRWQPSPRTSNRRASSTSARRSAKRCQTCARNSRRCRSKPTASPRGWTMSSAASNRRGI